ncbi:MAG: type II secretion system protein [Campylobacterota bacterium]|nr:type II secretion system protein [Campylobacterota bacterium]
MRKGLTLIELIFSMVIIGIVFSVVPKMIFASNKSLELSIKEDALYNAYSLMGSIVRLSWDENTLVAGKILDTGEHTCDNNRTGGFYGSRNCIDSDDTASSLVREDGNYNDIDDYNGETIEVDKSIAGVDKNIYDINVTVKYVDDSYNQSSTSTELKEITTTVFAGADNTKMNGFKSSFFYHSANLGHIQIKKRVWEQ